MQKTLVTMSEGSCNAILIKINESRKKWRGAGAMFSVEGIVNLTRGVAGEVIRAQNSSLNLQSVLSRHNLSHEVQCDVNSA